MSSFDNPDYVHLKSLSDMMKQIILWATAADAQAQILLAKKAPQLALPTASAPLAPATREIETNPTKIGLVRKDELRARALTLGVPADFIDLPEYLNGNRRPTLVGIRNTQLLLDAILECVIEGKSANHLWDGTKNDAPG